MLDADHISRRGVCYYAGMNRTLATMNAFLAGFGSAFSLFPAGHLDQFIRRDRVEDRIYDNFARVGLHLDAAMNKVRDEQKKQPAS